MAIRDVESYRFSPNYADFVTYNRFYQTTGYNTSQIVQNGYLGDPYLSFGSSGVGTANLLRRILPGGPFSTFGHSLRILVNKVASLQIWAYDLVNQKGHCYVQFNGSTGSITIGNSSGSLLTTNPGQFPVNALFWAQVMFVIGSGTSGAVYVKLPNTTINLAGINTLNGTRALADTTQYVASYGANHILMHGVWWDTSGSYNNAWLPDSRVFGSVVNANGDENDFTPVGNSTNYLNVANYPPNTNDYNQSATVGAIELYKGTSPSGVTSVAGVMLSSIMMKTDAGARSGAQIIKSGGTIQPGATVALPDSRNIQSDVFETDPSTNAPFVPSALPLLQRGVKLIA